MSNMKILVCGDRNYADSKELYDSLDWIRGLYDYPNVVVIEGEARGADTLGREWAKERGFSVLEFPADWDKHGRAAGPIRNKQMLEQEPDLVVAFHKDISSSKGTLNMITQANRANIPVMLFGGNY